MWRDDGATSISVTTAQRQSEENSCSFHWTVPPTGTVVTSVSCEWRKNQTKCIKMFRQKLLWKTLDNVYLGGLFQSWKKQYFTCSVKEHQLQVQVLIKLNYDSLIKHVLLDLALDPLRSSFQFEDQNLWQRKLLDSGWWMCDLSSLWSHQGHAVLVNVNVLTSSDLHRITMFTFAKDFFNDFFFYLEKAISVCCTLQNYLMELWYLQGENSKLLNTDTHRDEDGVHTEKWSGANALETDNNGRQGGERETHRQRDHLVFRLVFFWFLYRIPFSPLTLLGLTALCRFSIHLSLSAAERHAKHLVPDAVVTWGYRFQQPQPLVTMETETQGPTQCDALTLTPHVVVR